MKTSTALGREIAELKRDMTARGLRVTSSMNGGLSDEEFRLNNRLARLDLQRREAYRRGD